MEVGLARCKIAKGTISPERASKILIKIYVKELVHLNTIII